MNDTNAVRPPTGPGKAPRPRRRVWIRRIVGGLVVLMLACFLLGPQLITPLVRARLADMIGSQLNAELEIGRLTYSFPYGVQVHDARLIASDHGQPVELLRIPRLDVSLARLPLGGGPLVIKRLALRDPSVRLIRTADGIIGQRDLYRGERFASDGRLAIPRKLSEMLALREVSITGGQIVYEDRTLPQTVPVVWQDLQLELRTTPRSAGLYGFELLADNAMLAKLSAKGEFHIDEMTLALKQFTLAAQSDPDQKKSPLPTPLQEMLRSRRIAGKLNISGSANIDLVQMARCGYDVWLDLDGAAAKLPEWDADLDHLSFKIRCASRPHGRAGGMLSTMAATVLALAPPSTVYVDVDHIDARAGESSVRLSDAGAVVDLGNGEWNLTQLLAKLTLGKDRTALPMSVEKLLKDIEAHGTLEAKVWGHGRFDDPPAETLSTALRAEIVPRGLTVRPSSFPLPIEKLDGGMIRVMGRYLTVRDIKGLYGGDVIEINRANGEMSADNRQFRLTEIDAAVNFDGNERRYPSDIDAVLQQLRPKGVVKVAGSVEIPGLDAPVPVGYQLTVSADDASLAVSEHRFPLETVAVDVSVTPQLVEVKADEAAGRRGLSATAMGGRLTAVGQLKPGKVLTYQAEAEVKGLDLAALAKHLAAPGEKPADLRGIASGTILVSGSGPLADRTAVDNLRASGKVSVTDGDFWRVPLFAMLLDKIRPARDALTAGEAAAVFDIFDRKIMVDDAAIGASMLGLQGNGEIRFDGKMDLRVVAAPLGDWKEKLKGAGIPLVGPVAAELVGGIQKLINTATSNLIYAFRVEGTVGEPKISAEPVPVLTNSAAALFGQMIRGGDRPLVDQLKRKPKEK